MRKIWINTPIPITINRPPPEPIEPPSHKTRARIPTPDNKQSDHDRQRAHDSTRQQSDGTKVSHRARKTRDNNIVT